ncbi:MAG TPA: succinate dehydrogenase, cytochrome b556 subunit [Rhizomicrobium sp.]|jgi:succinate dehydrogenase / fumarate reductase cytochrome b subunit|nr:succinate dehydrogenase, cytochrome b556 subunit [Rhizomicrobium sp.]
MADTPHAAHRPRPLSPFVTIYHWPVTMATSIVHRVTGCALAAGTVLLALWLYSVSSGFVTYNRFMDLAATPLGQVILFGFTWSLAYHLLNGIRHLAWDMGYGFSIPAARRNSIIVIAGSILIAAGVFAIAYTGHGGYYK